MIKRLAGRKIKKKPLGEMNLFEIEKKFGKIKGDRLYFKKMLKSSFFKKAILTWEKGLKEVNKRFGGRKYISLGVIAELKEKEKKKMLSEKEKEILKAFEEGANK